MECSTFAWNTRGRSHTWHSVFWRGRADSSALKNAKTSSPQPGHEPFNATKFFLQRPCNARTAATVVGYPIEEPNPIASIPFATVNDFDAGIDE